RIEKKHYDSDILASSRIGELVRNLKSRNIAMDARILVISYMIDEALVARQGTSRSVCGIYGHLHLKQVRPEWATTETFEIALMDSLVPDRIHEAVASAGAKLTLENGRLCVGYATQIGIAK